jgi:hypothetical protein
LKVVKSGEEGKDFHQEYLIILKQKYYLCQQERSWLYEVKVIDNTLPFSVSEYSLEILSGGLCRPVPFAVSIGA